MKAKSKRFHAIIEYRHAHPRATLREVGQVFKITRERVRQILLKYGEPTA